MHIKTVKADSIHYNPSTSAFEAVVHIKTEQGNYRYPCAYDAALTTPLTTPAFHLTQQAKVRHRAGEGLRTYMSAPDPIAA